MTDPVGYLLDTNVLSELRSPRPNSRVLAFTSILTPKSSFVSVLTLGELYLGGELKRDSDPAKAVRLKAWVDNLRFQFSDRILGVDLQTAIIWAELSAQRTRPVVDTLLAATAIAHNLAVVTRNTRDFSDTGAITLNPWS